MILIQIVLGALFEKSCPRLDKLKGIFTDLKKKVVKPKILEDEGLNNVMCPELPDRGIQTPE